VIDRSGTQDTPEIPLALEAALMFGTCVAEAILASVHVRTQQQAGHMDASDQIKLSRNILRVGGRPHKGIEPAAL
jgi:hypothetical protein